MFGVQGNTQNPFWIRCSMEMLDPFLLAEKFQPSQRMVIQEGWKVPTLVPAEWLNLKTLRAINQEFPR